MLRYISMVNEQKYIVGENIINFSKKNRTIKNARSVLEHLSQLVRLHHQYWQGILINSIRKLTCLISPFIYHNVHYYKSAIKFTRGYLTILMYFSNSCNRNLLELIQYIIHKPISDKISNQLYINSYKTKFNHQHSNLFLSIPIKKPSRTS